MTESLQHLVSVLRASPGWTSKAEIAVVRDVLGPGDWHGGPGDDGAVVSVGDHTVIACGEAILPSFVEHDPYGAGVAAVLTNVNDVAAMGAVPLAIVDTLVGSREMCRAALEGMREASRLYDVPVVGGHLTYSSDRTALSAFALGRCPGRVLSANNVVAGMALGLVVCLDGTMRADFPFFPSFDERGTQLAGDVRLLAELATAGACRAAKDVSMAGLFGSLAMLLEPTRCGVTIDLGDVPVPDDVTFEQWSTCFPCLAFLVCSPPEREDHTAELTRRRGLTYASLGSIDETGAIRLCDATGSAVLVDLRTESITGLRAP